MYNFVVIVYRDLEMEGRVCVRKNLMNFLTGELFLPSRTANQYLARYWFAVRDGKNSSPVKKFIIGCRPEV